MTKKYYISCTENDEQKYIKVIDEKNLKAENVPVLYDIDKLQLLSTCVFSLQGDPQCKFKNVELKMKEVE